MADNPLMVSHILFGESRLDAPGQPRRPEVEGEDEKDELTGKIDLCIWTLNSEKTLDRCLESVQRAIPRERVCHRIAVDGYSNDGTRKILEDYGWTVYQCLPGIPRQANLALSKVDTDYFACFEHDIILSPGWLSIVDSMRNSSLATTGFRVYKGSNTLAAINLYAHQKNRAAWNYSIDNTIFDTERLRRLGGFPVDCPRSTDSLLREKALENGMTWEVDEKALAYHLRGWYGSALQHDLRQMLQARYIWSNTSRRSHSLLTAPFAGALIAGVYHAPWTLLAYPIQRLSKRVIILVSRGKVRKVSY